MTLETDGALLAGTPEEDRSEAESGADEEDGGVEQDGIGQDASSI